MKEPNAKGLVVSPTPGRAYHYGPGSFGGIDIPMSSIVGTLENLLKQPVLDETGLTNHYDLALTWRQKSPDDPDSEDLRQAVREQLGLELVPAVRPVEMVRIAQNKEVVPVPSILDQ